jgi:hypothetical protein
MADRWVEAASHLQAETRRRFDAVRRAILTHGDRLRAIPGVLGLRPGFRFTAGWITDEPAIVVTVREKRPPGQVPEDELIPRELAGVPVDVTPATPIEQLRSRARTRGLPVRPWPGVEYEPALPDWERDPDAASREIFDTERAATRPYVPPPEPPLDEVSGAATVTCHASPDAGWTTLGPFLAGTRDRLTVGMYDFSAPHVLAGLRDAMTAARASLRLVLDPGLTLSRGTDPSRPKARDVTEEVVVEALRTALGDRFSMAWAAVKRSGKTSGGFFPSAYHIKAAVRDGEALWLSSGNWQSSNQPDPDRIGPGPDPAEILRAYNREWHIVVESPGLARVFERYLEHDLAEALPLQSVTREVRPEGPEVLIPADEEARPPGRVRFFEPRTVTATVRDPLRIQPLLTPDNYARHVVEVIRSARRSLYFQNQYIAVNRRITASYQELLNTLRDKANDAALDVRIILRDGGDSRSMLETLKAQGFPTDRIRLQRGCHNKGIVVDSAVVVLGSHNWSSDGTSANRDASLIIHHPEIAAYYESIFLHDWEHLARARTLRDRRLGQPAVAGPETPTPRGMIRVPWDEFEEELDEAGRLASVALMSEGSGQRVEGNDQAPLPRLDLTGRFLRVATRGRPGYLVANRQGGTWSIDAGRFHGLPAPTSGEAVTLALFASGASDEALNDPGKAPAKARISQVGGTRSQLEIIEGTVDPAADRLKAVIIHLPGPRLRVGLEGDPLGVGPAREALASSPFVREPGAGESAELRLIARGGQYWIVGPDDDRPMVGQVDGFTEASAWEAVQRLEHIERWKRIAELDNPATSIGPDEVRVEILRDGMPLTGSEIRLEYARGDGQESVPPEVTIRLENTGMRTLHVGLLDLPQTFGIFPMLSGLGSQKLAPGEEVFANRGEPIAITVPDEFWRQGVSELRDIVKVLVSTSEFDARRLKQEDLDLPRPATCPAGLEIFGVTGDIEELGAQERPMERVATRHAGPGAAKRIDDWETLQFAFTTVRPLPAERL